MNPYDASMTNADDQLRARLGRAVAARRTGMGLSVNKAAQQAEIGRTTWIAIEKGSRDAEDYIYSKVAKVLGWTPEHLQAIRRGEDTPTVEAPAPEPAREPARDRQPTQWDPELLRLASVFADPDVPASQKMLLKQQLRLWVDQIDLQRQEIAATRRKRSA